jgi:hypothetical protein
MERWEHRVLTYKSGNIMLTNPNWKQLEVDLNALGAEGWETVGMIAPGRTGGTASDMAVVLKRRKPE